MAELLDPDSVPLWLAGVFRESRGGRIIAGVNDDDCAVLSWDDPVVVVSTDFLNSQPIALQLGLGGLGDIGRLLVATNLSDLCGTGAEPRALLIGVTLEWGSTTDDFKQLMEGVRAEAARWGVPVVGGDTKLGSSRAVLGVAVGSAVSTDCLFLKNRGRAGDLLWCSGPLGGCNAAVLGLTRASMPDVWAAWAREAILVPRLPLESSRALARHRLGSAGIDVSDGLGADVRRLCEASRTGVVLTADSIPVEPQTVELATRLGIPPWTIAFGCGGDFQFLATTAPEHRRVAEGIGLHRIGALTEDRHMLIRLSDGRTVAMPGEGHRDGRRMTFADEVHRLVLAAAEAARGAC